MVKTKLLHSVGSVFGTLLFVLALWVLHTELKTYHLHDIVNRTRALPAHRVFLAFLLTVLSYLIMTGYDTLALRYIRRPLGYAKTAIASFIGYSFSNNIGLSMLAGGSVRFRLYTTWGLSVWEITKVVFFCTATLWLGFLTLAGVIFIMEPLAIPQALHIPFASVQTLGVIALIPVGAFLIGSLLRKEPLKIRGWEFTIPSIKLFGGQMIVALLDWFVAGCVLYVLLPAAPSLSFLGVLGIFLLGQLAGLASQVPGGLGVFETVVLFLLSPTLPTSAILGSLLAYRGIYYLLPLLIATIMLASLELLQKKDWIQRIARGFGQWLPVLVPQVMAFATFIGGAILLFSGATPGNTLAFLLA